MQLVGVSVLPVQVLAHSFGGKLRLADVAEVSGQVDRLTWGQEHSDAQELGVHKLRAIKRIFVALDFDNKESRFKKKRFHQKHNICI